MHKMFSSIDELFAYIKEDKEWTGANAGLHNRYPIRFVLFDNFADFNEFVVNRPTGIFKQSIEALLDPQYPDSFLSYTELSKEIRSFIKQIPINDYIIYPFSEMARFYDNDTNTEFEALVKTIRGAQAPEDAQEEHVRIYIPIVGMQGKMGKFIDDHTTFVWEYKSEEATDKGTYTLIITDGTTYDVTGLNDKYSVVSNLYEWLRLWEKGEHVKQTIICSSPNIFANYRHARPDNAFTYLKCDNAFQFLAKGLQIDFGVIEEPDEEEMPYWEQLASLIDITSFNFDDFVKERIDTYTLQNGIDFIKSWLDCTTDFDRWLLTVYFRKISDKNSYIYRAVSSCANLSKPELFSNIATHIFDESNKEASTWERLQAMKLAAANDVNITELARTKIKAKLKAIAISPEQGGYYMAVKLLTPLTDEEQQLAIEWIAQGSINIKDIKDVYPNLYNYLRPFSINFLSEETDWIVKYFNAYRHSKIADNINDEVESILKSKNGDTASFQNWYDQFKTVKTILHNRKDIDVFYWIDGLGVDWLPFIREIISQYSKEHIYLNEIHIAVSDIPTTTSNNKDKLLALLSGEQSLPKVGDIDTFAHSAKSYPQYIIEEMKKVEMAVKDVLDKYNGKKIAFVSDHGITYLAQKAGGLKLVGINPDHEGRLATYTSDTFSADNNYLTLPDKKMICALTHKSLTDKVNKGHGAHGGCTPEELLVPIIIVSSQKNANNFSVELEDDEVNGTNPVLRLTIKGLSSIDVPTLLYNEVRYNLVHIGGNKYQSERLNIVDTASKVTVFINADSIRTFNIKISTGIEEDDSFGF